MPDDLIELISKLFPVRAIAHSANEERPCGRDTRVLNQPPRR